MWPGAKVKIIGSKVELSGAAADQRLGWTDRLKNSLGNLFQVGSFNIDSAIASATQSFRSGMKTLLAADDACSGNKLTDVFDLQVVNFARSSATLPQDTFSTLGDTAQLLKSCAAKGAMVNLEIVGYSDSQGPAAANLEMSKARAIRARFPRTQRRSAAVAHGDRLWRCQSGRGQRNGQRPLHKPSHRVHRQGSSL